MNVKNIMLNLRNKLAYIKVYYVRSSGYIGMFNTALILFLSLTKLQERGINIDKIYFVPIFILMFILFIFFGYLDLKLGFYKEEGKINANNVPQFNEILTEIKKLGKK